MTPGEARLDHAQVRHGGAARSGKAVTPSTQPGVKYLTVPPPAFAFPPQAADTPTLETCCGTMKSTKVCAVLVISYASGLVRALCPLPSMLPRHGNPGVGNGAPRRPLVRGRQHGYNNGCSWGACRDRITATLSGETLAVGAGEDKAFFLVIYTLRSLGGKAAAV